MWSTGFAICLNHHKAMHVDQEALEIDKVKILRGHEKEVFACSWNPVRDMLATASGDSTARLWSFEEVIGSIRTKHHH